MWLVSAYRYSFSDKIETQSKPDQKLVALIFEPTLYIIAKAFHYLLKNHKSPTT